jgi:hypothetical protein
VASIVLSVLPVGSAVAPVLGATALLQMRRRTDLRGRALAWAGIAVGLVATGLMVLAAWGVWKATEALAMRPDVALRAAELGLRIPSATVSVKAPKLTGRADIGIDVSASVEGAAPASLKGSIVVDRLLTPEGAPVVDLAGIHGTIALADLPTAPFERFAKDTGVVLARDVGPTVALDAAFADAAGGDLSVRLRSAAVTLTAAGSVDPATRAATFRSIEKSPERPSLTGVRAWTECEDS